MQKVTACPCSNEQGSTCVRLCTQKSPCLPDDAQCSMQHRDDMGIAKMSWQSRFRCNVQHLECLDQQNADVVIIVPPQCNVMTAVFAL